MRIAYYVKLSVGVPPVPREPDPIPDLILVILYALFQTKGQIVSIQDKLNQPYPSHSRAVIG